MLDRKCTKVFGAANHKYNFNPCSTEDQIQDVEGKYHVQLPMNYREFLLHIGNGGAGPGHGLLTLQSSLKETLFPHRKFDANEDTDYLAKPFHNNTTEFVLSGSCSGSLVVADHGCTYTTNLVLSGMERGNVWLIFQDHTPHTFSLADQSHVDFFTWYMKWLDVHIVALLAGEDPKSNWGFGNFWQDSIGDDAQFWESLNSIEDFVQNSVTPTMRDMRESLLR